VITALLITGVLQALTAVPVHAPDTTRPAVLTVREGVGGRATQIPLVTTATGTAVRADRLATALGGTVEPLSDGRFRMALPGVTIQLADGWPFARADTVAIPLPEPPYVDAGHLYLPLTVLADVVPHIATGILYDPAHVEIRIFAGLPPPRARHISAPPPEPPSGAAPSATPTPTPTPSDQPGAADDRGAGSTDPSGDVLVADSAGPNTREIASPGEAPPLTFARQHLVAVDAGHGGPDNGMRAPLGGRDGAEIIEKDITLAVASQVGAELRARGIGVMQTRTTDTLIALDDRGRMANARRADLFLSIHVNAANPAWHDPTSTRGFETYILATAKTEDARRVERMENEAVRFEPGGGTGAHDPLNFIMKDMEQNEHLRESSDLADLIQQHLARVHPGPSRGVKQAGFRVLVTAYMPAVLVEIGFGTNVAEARFLSDPAGQHKIAAAVAAAAAEYLARYDHRVGTTVQ
jgi:N-acetylmuramoyl-L-alanine amidase